jgi:hypothetical protein
MEKGGLVWVMEMRSYICTTRARGGGVLSATRTAAPLSPRVLIVNMSDDEDYYIFKPPLELIRPFCATTGPAPTPSPKNAASTRAEEELCVERRRSLLIVSSICKLTQIVAKNNIISAWWIAIKTINLKKFKHF